MSQGVKKQAQGEQVLLTGITGFVAGHIAVQLLRRGYRVRGTVRSVARATGVADRLREQSGSGEGELSLVEADLMHDAGWDAAAEDCRYVIHTASPFPMRAPKHEDELVRPAREGTLRVLEATRRAGAERVVLTSSIAAINYGHGAAPFTEADWTEVDGPVTTPYYKSKTVAEQAAWHFAREHALELAVINPGLVLGPLLDARNGTSVDLVRKLLAGEFPGLPDFGFSLVDVRDVADAHLRAMTVPAAAGERFIAAGRFLSVREIADVLREAFPQYARKLPRRRLPDWLVRLAARFDADLRSVVGDLGYDSRVSHDKATRVLGWQPRDEAASIRDTAASLIAFGLV
jgi:dihydroflavonol-4-reductase